MTIDDATRAQIRSADPTACTWLAANAGSGKTRVLTNRVARLLLQGVSPQNILCLTYTKAAASEMQNRLFRQLGTWSMLPDERLERELSELGATLPSDGGLEFARTLFARAIETPGGLRIQTIHSFCASMLRRFPLEAGVSPVFREMDERDAALLRNDVLEDLAQGPDSDAVERLAAFSAAVDLEQLVAEVTKNAALLMQPRGADDIWSQFGLPPGYSEQDLLDAVFGASHTLDVASIVEVLRNSEKPTDHKTATLLESIDFDAPRISDYEVLHPYFLFGKTAKSPFSAKTGSIPTAGLRKNFAEVFAPLHNFMERIEDNLERYKSLQAARKTLALHQFAAVYLPEYETRKRDRGLLDFDDLIHRSIALLSDPAVAQWVLFKLDGGIDHILVDEAQDTSPAQWKVIELLAQEFSAGEGARAGVKRTIFVVGDFKQSIYSFQGADPRAFDQMKSHFSDALAGVGEQLHERSLDHSFRSSPAILEFVDATFGANGGRGIGGVPHHIAYHAQMPGRVDIWPLLEGGDEPENREWFDPTDMMAENDPKLELAANIARWIDEQCRSGLLADQNGDLRPIHPGDFLILVQRRSPLFHEIIRACKSLDLPIAGADRLKVGGELAVKDLLALLSFLAMPADDLSLAAALRSPIFSISEAELFDLAHGRGKATLWSALVSRQQDHAAAHAILSDLRSRVDYFSPYELLERILIRHGARTRLLARLGHEAEDGIDALLDLALTFERNATPSLTGFLVWQEAGDIEIKRQAEGTGGRIRVMTTHGAKGLESPIVILPDTTDRNPPQGREILADGDGRPVWLTPADQQTPAMKELVEAGRGAGLDERFRLLYVAMTRAEKWLVVCGAGKARPDGDSWYRQAEAGMTQLGGAPIETPAGGGLRHQRGNWRATSRPDAKPGLPPANPAAPGWALQPAPPPGEKFRLLSPSDMDGPKSLPGSSDALDETAARLRGTRIHLLLQHLPDVPKTAWRQAAVRLLSSGTPRPTDSELEEALAHATHVLQTPELAWVFAENSLAEVSVSAEASVGQTGRYHGVIDRLVVTDDKVSVVDFKTNRVVPSRPDDIPLGILQQMAVYREMIEPIYPDRPIDLYVLWTGPALLMPIPHDLVTGIHDTV